MLRNVNNKDVRYMNTENFKFHITYNTNMTLKELSELLANINVAINNYYRDNGIRNNTVSSYAPIVNKVDNGSILLDIAIAVFSGLTATLLAEFIMDRIRKLQKSEKKNDKNLNNVCIVAGDDNTINIHIGDID